MSFLFPRDSSWKDLTSKQKFSGLLSNSSDNLRSGFLELGFFLLSEASTPIGVFPVNSSRMETIYASIIDVIISSSS